MDEITGERVDKKEILLYFFRMLAIDQILNISKNENYLIFLKILLIFHFRTRNCIFLNRNQQYSMSIR